MEEAPAPGDLAVGGLLQGDEVKVGQSCQVCVTYDL